MRTEAEATTAGVAIAAGITYRQLDYWCSRGWIGEGMAATGAGHGRVWTEAAVRRAILMGRLVRAGLAIIPAWEAAKQIESTGRAELREGFVLVEGQP